MRQPFATVVPLFALGVGLFVAPSAAAMRCGQRVVSAGDTPIEVRARCGAPTSVETRTEEHQVVLRDAEGGVVRVDVLTTLVELWVYDFGPRRLMIQLRFRDGRVEAEAPLGYGSAEQAPPDGPAPRR